MKKIEEDKKLTPEEKGYKLIDDYSIKHGLKADDKIERLYRKSMSKEETEIHGEMYTGRNITIDNKKVFLRTVLAILTFAASIRGAVDINLLSEYKAMENTKIEKELTEEEAKHVKRVNVFDLPELRKRIKENDGEYDYTGDRLDGTHNEFYHFDPEAIVGTTDKDLDTMEEIIDEKIDGAKGYK